MHKFPLPIRYLPSQNLVPSLEQDRSTETALFDVWSMMTGSLEEFEELIGQKTGVDLPGSDVLMKRLDELGLPQPIVKKICDALSEINPTFMSVVLTKNLSLDPEQKALVNAALAPFGLRLDMTIHDLWVQQPNRLTKEQRKFLFSPADAPPCSKEFCTWIRRHRFEVVSVTAYCTVLEAWARIRLSRNHPHRAEMDKILRTVGLTVDTDIPYEDLE